eukprot:m.1429804 g.1429804  ORF g.1429804 m.1429804 type:complete len:1055 (+) comp25070_c0_seq4:182-3346(+)
MFKLPVVSTVVTRGCASPGPSRTCNRLATTIERLWRPAPRVNTSNAPLLSPTAALQRQLEPHIRAQANRFLLPNSSAEGSHNKRSLYTNPTPSASSSTIDGHNKPKTPPRPISVLDIKRKYDRKQAIKMVTAYDTFSAKTAEAAGMDMLLVGDSLGMVVLGRPDTVSVTVDEMIHHCKAVAAGATLPLVVGDMPFGSYVTENDAKQNAIRLLKEGGVDIVKLEGGKKLAPMAKAITDVGIGVVGHIGLTPQTAVVMGGFCCQGKTVDAAMALMEDALTLQAAGCMAIVLECVPEYVAKRITERLEIPTIGIGAGKHTSGQVLVFHDILGLYEHTPRLARQFLPGNDLITNAIRSYGDAVEAQQFPAEENTFKMLRGERVKFSQMFDDCYGSVKTESTPMISVPEPSEVHPIEQPIRNVCVIGGGALGSFVAAKLAALGDVSITVVSDWRDDAVHEHINAHGLCIDGHGSGVESVSADTRNVRLVRKIDAVPVGSADVVIIATKAMEAATAIASGASACNPQHGTILTLHNGLGNEIPTLDPTGFPILPGVVTHGAKLQGPDQVVQTGRGAISIGVSDPRDAPVAQRVQELLNRADLNADSVLGAAAVHSMQWQKLLINSVINPLTTLARGNNGTLTDPIYNDVIDDIIAEVRAVATASGIALPSGPGALRALVDDVICNTAANTSSMLSDVLEGTPTEIAAINGCVVAAGARVGVPTPINRALVALVQGLGTEAGVAGDRGMGTRHAKTRPYNGPVVIDSIAAMQQLRRELGRGVTVGCVPTMGGLHDGHLDLARRAKAENDIVVATIFVNQKQFAAHEDFGIYPRQLEVDLALLHDVGVDYVLHPAAEEMYGEGFGMAVCVDGMDALSEGAARPGFFDGVATVCTKLFNIVSPDRVYFGQKDALQCVVIQKLVRELNFPLDVVVCPTTREADGLAMSSRNRRLTPEQRHHAPLVFATLSSVAAAWQEAAESMQADAVRSSVHSALTAHNAVASIDYVSLMHPSTGLEISGGDVVPDGAILSTAVTLAGGATEGHPVRLLDNVVLARSPPEFTT